MRRFARMVIDVLWEPRDERGRLAPRGDRAQAIVAVLLFGPVLAYVAWHALFR